MPVMGARPGRAVRGRTALERLWPALDDLHAAAGVPITARRTWLSTWAACYDDREPVAIVLEDPGGRVDAAALLARRRRGPLTEVVALGDGLTDHARLPARDDVAATRLGGEIARWLASIRGPWRATLRQLPAGDPAALAIARALPLCTVRPVEGSPTVRFGPDRERRTYVGRNYGLNVNKGYNRLRRAGLDAEVEVTRDPERARRLLPELLRVHRARDHGLGRVSDLDHARPARFWTAVTMALAARGEVELTVLRVEGTAAAYVLALLDGSTYRIWTSRFDPRFERFNPGLLADTAALDHALGDPRFEEFDWMRGEEAYKLRTANEVVPSELLEAWSGGAVRALAALPERARSAARRNPRLVRLWRRTRRRRLVGPAAPTGDELGAPG